MIYGSFAKQYANTDNHKFQIMSESDAILEYLIKEQNNYSSLLLSESYIDEKERIIMEAKIEVLQEALSGIIITAVITVLGVLSALLIKFMSILNNGAKQVEEHSKKVAENITNNKPDDKEQQNTDNGQAENNSKSSTGKPIYGSKAKEEADKKAEMNRIRREYRNKVDNLIARVKYDFKNGNIDTQSSWFKIMLPKLEADFKSSMQSDKFHGFSDYDYLRVVNTKAVKDFNDDVRAASTDRDISEIKVGLINKTGSYVGLVGYNGADKTAMSEKLRNIVDNPYSILNDTFAKSFSAFSVTSSYDVLISHFNSVADDSMEYAATTAKRFQKEKVISKATKAIEFMNKDIKTLEKTLERLKNEKFNASDIVASTVTIPDPNINKKGYLKAVNRQNDNIDIANQNRQMFINNMMYIERESLNMFTNFTKGWGELEQYRLMYIRNFNKIFGVHVGNAVTKSIYNDYKMKYGDLFTIEDPCPDYN